MAHQECSKLSRLTAALQGIFKTMRTKARGGWGGRRSLRRDRTGVGLVAQPGVTVQLAPNSRAPAAECATSETIFLLSFALSQPRPHTQAVPGQQQGGKQTPSALHSNTQGRVRNNLWEMQEHRTRHPSVDKKGNKRLRFKSMKKHQELLCPRSGTQFKAAVEVVQWFTLFSPPP